MQVGVKQNGAIGGARKGAEQLDPDSGQSGVQPQSRIAGRVVLFELVGPPIAHDRQGPERVSGRRLDPHAAQEAGDNHVLLERRQHVGERGSGLTPLEQQCAGVLEQMRVDEPHGSLAPPSAETFGLMLCLGMPPPDLQYHMGTGLIHGGGHPRCAAAGLIRPPHLQRPPARELGHYLRQGSHPHSARRSRAVVHLNVAHEIRRKLKHRDCTSCTPLRCASPKPT